MHFSENDLNSGLDLANAWQDRAKTLPAEYSEHVISYLKQELRARVKDVINPQEDQHDSSLIFLAAIGREMYNYQKEEFLSIFNTLSNQEMGDLIAIYKGYTERDPQQARLLKLIPELETILNTRIDQEKQAPAE